MERPYFIISNADPDIDEQAYRAYILEQDRKIKRSIERLISFNN